MTSKMFAGRYYSHSARLEKIKEEQVNIREVKKWLSSEYQNCPIIFNSNPSSFSVTYQNVWNKRAFSVVDIFIIYPHFIIIISKINNTDTSKPTKW